MAGPKRIPVAFDAVRAELRRRLTRRGMQRRVAHELGISVPTLSNILHGRRTPIARVAASLGFRRVVSYERDE
jgi:predicted transcriptional regulator